MSSSTLRHPRHPLGARDLGVPAHRRATPSQRRHNSQLRARVRVVAPDGDDALFLMREAEEASERYRGKRGVLLRAARRIPSVLRGGVIVALLAILAGFGVLGTSDEARSINFRINTFCQNQRLELDPDRAVDAGHGDTRTENKTELPKTTWAQYGMAGIKWEGNFLDCNPGTWFFTWLSNLLFFVPMWFTGYIIMFFQWVFEGHVIRVFTETGGGGDAPLDIIVGALYNGFFMGVVAIAIIVGALVLFWRAFFQNAGLADVLSKVLLMVLVWGFAMWFASNAAYATQGLNDMADKIVAVSFSAFSKATCEVGTQAEGATSNCDSPGESYDPNGSAAGVGNEIIVPCADSEPNNDGGMTVKQAGAVDCIGQVMYHAMVFQPWATGEIGPLRKAGENNTAGDEEYKKRMKLAYAILDWQAVGRGEEEGNDEHDPMTNKEKNNPGGWAEDADDNSADGRDEGDPLDTTGKNDDGEKKGYGCPAKHPSADDFARMMNLFGDDAIRDDLENGAWKGDLNPDSDVTATGNERYLYRTCTAARQLQINTDITVPWPGENPRLFVIEGMSDHYRYGFWERNIGQTDADTSDEGDGEDLAGNALYFKVFAGNDGNQRFLTAIVALVAGMAMAVTVLLVAGLYLLLQIATVAFAIMAPIAAVLGMIPVFGFQIFLKWGQLFLGTYLKRIGLALFTGFLMVMYTMVLLMPFDWYMQIAVLIGIALVGFMYQGKFAEVIGMGGANQAMKAAGGTALAAGAKGGWRFGANRAQGFRLRRAKYKGAMDASKDKTDEAGNPLSKWQRRKEASAIAAKPRIRPGKLDAEKRRARADGAKGAKDKATKRGYGTDKEGIKDRKASVQEAQQAITEYQQQAHETGGKKLSKGQVERINKAAQRGQLVLTREEIRSGDGSVTGQAVHFDQRFSKPGRGKTMQRSRNIASAGALKDSSGNVTETFRGDAYRADGSSVKTAASQDSRARRRVQRSDARASGNASQTSTGGGHAPSDRGGRHRGGRSQGNSGSAQVPPPSS